MQNETMNLNEQEQKAADWVSRKRKARKADQINIDVDIDGAYRVMIDFDNERVMELCYTDDYAYDIAAYLNLLRYNKVGDAYAGYFGEFSEVGDNQLQFYTSCGPDQMDERCPQEVEEALLAVLAQEFGADNVDIASSESLHEVTFKDGENFKKTVARITKLLKAAGWKKFA